MGSYRLKMQGDRLSDQFPIPKIGGAVTAIGDVAVILDRLGHLYSCASGGNRVDRLPFPDLPNNISDYLKVPDAIRRRKEIPRVRHKIFELCEDACRLS